MSELFQVNPGQLYHGQKPIRDPEHRRFVKSHPCAACGQTWGVDPCHTGPHGTSQKACDLTVIPLCRKCHDKFDDNPREFAEANDLDIPALIQQFTQERERRMAA
jgi:hypothetical protein